MCISVKMLPEDVVVPCLNLAKLYLINYVYIHNTQDLLLPIKCIYLDQTLAILLGDCDLL